MSNPQPGDPLESVGDEALRALFKATPLPTWVHERDTGHLLAANPAMLEQYGLEARGLGSVKAEDLGWKPEFGEDGEATDGNGSANVQIATAWHSARDGRTFMARTTARAVDGPGGPAWLVIAEPLIPYEEAPARGEGEGGLGVSGAWGRLLDRTLTRLPDGFFIVDRQWRFTFVNAEAARMLGASRSHLQGRGLWEELPELADTPFARVYEGAMHEGRTSRVEAKYPASERWYRVHAYPVDEGVAAYFQDITAEHEAQTRLHFQSQLLERIDQPIMAFDASDRVTYWNRGAEELFGWSADDMLGHEAMDALLHEGDRNRYTEARGRAEDGEPWSGELRFRNRAGEEVICWTSTAPARNPDGSAGGRITTAVDVTERKGMEEALRESETLFRQIAEAVRTVFWIERPGQRGLEYVSPAYAGIWGRNPEELYRNARRWLDFVHPEDRDRVRRALSGAFDGGYEVEYRIERSDGSLRWIWERAFPIVGDDGRVYRAVGISEDVTERKELEEELRQAQKMEALGRLCGGVAHDFNNRLTVIEGASQTLLEDLPSDPSLEGTVREILGETEQLAQLTHQLLAYSRRQVLNERTLDLRTVLAEMEPMLRRLLPETVELHLGDSGEACLVRSDLSRLEQVVLNLVINAADAVAGGGHIQIRTEKAGLGPSAPECMQRGVPPGHYICLTVEDTGPGIEPHLQDRIFEPFFTTKPEGMGTGLGLSTVYGTVTQSEGQILVDSRPGEGAVFRVFFPEAMGPDEGEPTGRSPRVRASEPSHSGTVLLVEDEAAVRNAARRALQRSGFTVVEACSGEEALQWIRHDGLDPEVVVTDVVMPEMSGPELLAELRGQGSEAGVVLISGYSSEELGEEARRESTMFLEKPFGPSDLIQAVREALARSGTPAGSG